MAAFLYITCMLHLSGGKPVRQLAWPIMGAHLPSLFPYGGTSKRQGNLSGRRHCMLLSLPTLLLLEGDLHPHLIQMFVLFGTFPNFLTRWWRGHQPAICLPDFPDSLFAHAAHIFGMPACLPAMRRLSLYRGGGGMT